MFTYAHVKWFCGQSECTYYLNYFIKHFQDITFDITEYVPMTCKHFQRLLKMLQWISNSSNVRSGARRQTWGDYIKVLARSLPRRPLGLKRKKTYLLLPLVLSWKGDGVHIVAVLLLYVIQLILYCKLTQTELGYWRLEGVWSLSEEFFILCHYWW